MSGTHGEYRLLERLAIGGMAELFRAKLCGVEGFERTVAVKRILPELAGDPQFVEMFLDEARIAARLSHPNIVHTIDLCQSDGAYFIAMELIEGVDVRRLLKRCHRSGAPIPRRHACRIVAEVCAGLAYAHNKRDGGRRMNLVHRDVSPPNVLVSTGGEVKLIDFGIARATRARRARTQHGTLKGKLGYMSPEQVTGRPVDHRTDIFSAGVLLWELLTVEHLFRGRERDVLEQIQRCRPAPPSRRNPAVPPELDRIVARALARNPRDRYQDAAELHDRLCHYMESTGDRGSACDLATWTARVMSPQQSDAADPPTVMAPARFRPRRSRSAAPARGTLPPASARGTVPPVTVTFSEHPGQVFVRFESEPAGARVVVVSDGVARRIGTTPVQAFLDPGVPHHISMRKAGHATWAARRVFPRRGSHTVSAAMPTKRAGDTRDTS